MTFTRGRKRGEPKGENEMVFAKSGFCSNLFGKCEADLPPELIIEDKLSATDGVV